MTRQMLRGSQVAFAKAWLERKGIEAQTVDIHSLIDSSLSYEENIKNVKSYLGMGGRSEKKATRIMSAAECDVAIGNCHAGFVEDCKDACECGDPDACDVAGETVSTPPTKKPAPAPKFKTAKTAKPKKSAPRKTTKSKTSTKPAKAKARKPKATQKADIKLTAAQRKRLNATGHVTVKRGGKFITITK